MSGMEQKIKDFVKSRGVDVVGIAGPDRLDGPPSLDPTYTMKGARSVITMAIPMNVPAIFEFLGKKSPVPHNLDQLRGNQRTHQVCSDTADFIRLELGKRAMPVPPNNTYRRSLDVFTTHPSFSHRFGALVTGIGAQGWSGNIMTKEYGAAVFLGSLVTDAELESDPVMPPRYFIDNFCVKCKVCEKSCVGGMFSESEEEYVLLNGGLHPRAKRLNIDFCNSSCFGLHAISRDKRWTTWGRHWIKEWTDKLPEPEDRKNIRKTFMKKGAVAGDSTLRFDLIRRLGSKLWPQELLDELPEASDLPKDELERNKILSGYANKIGVRGLKDYNVLTCGQCALVCGPTLRDTAERFNMLIESGLVVPGPEGRMVNAETFEKAAEIRKLHPQKNTRAQIMADSRASFLLWHKYYFGFEPKSVLQNFMYRRKLKKAVEKLS